MKIFILGSIGGFASSQYAACYVQDWEHAHCPNNFPWWKWGAVCPACHIASEIERVPWQMRWLEGSNKIGDVAASGLPCWNMIVQRKVLEFFCANDYFVNCSPVEFEQIPPPSPRSRKPVYPCVPTTPYIGPSFWGIRPRYGVHINNEKSHKVQISKCSVCGHIRYDTTEEYFWNNFVVDEEEWNGLKLFGIFEFGRLLMPGDGLFLSEEGYELLLHAGLTNIKCQEVGRIEKLGTGIRKLYRETADYDFWKPEEYVELPIPKKHSKIKNK
ncbi:hypothetical protein FACS18942_07580 [Planctomycetales bacterium]|nr:hypothetical protein FACS18942_07580 [Planctomycetales bacterium]